MVSAQSIVVAFICLLRRRSWSVHNSSQNRGKVYIVVSIDNSINMECDKMKKYKEVYIKRWNNGEMNFKNERTIVNGYELEMVMGSEWTQNILLEVAKKCDIPNDGELWDITTMQFDQENIEEELKELIPQIWEHFEHKGADDGTYDYFPDLMYAFEQICIAFRREDIYNTIALELNEKEYDENGEPFSLLSRKGL